MARVADLPFRFSDGAILVEATLNGAPAQLVFDTGSGTSVLTDAAVHRLHLHKVQSGVGEVVGIGGSRRASLVIADRFELGALRGDHFTFLAAPVFGTEPGQADGLLSTDFLSKYDIDLDFPEHKIILYYPVNNCSQPGAALDQPLYALPLIVQAPLYGHEAEDQDVGKTPDVAVTIDGLRTFATIDTGSTRTSIFRDSAARHGLDIDTLTKDSNGVANGVGAKQVRAVLHVLTPITIGELTIAHLPAAILDQHHYGDVDMLLGLDFLSRVHIWISYSSQQLIMQFPPKPSPPITPGAAALSDAK